MPTYVYRREDGTTFEAVQRMTDPPLEVDPETGQKVKRMIGAGAGLIFKGSGFYITDYARKGNGGDSSGKEGEAQKSSEATGSGEAKNSNEKSSKDSKPSASSSAGSSSGESGSASTS